MNRAVTVGQLMRTKLKLMQFEGPWLDSLGDPELTGSWFIWGPPGNGKTRFALQLAKYLSSLGFRVLYDSLEEGASKSIRDAFADINMIEVARKFMLLDQEPIEDLIQRLSKRKSPDIIFIDSLQYSGMNYHSYKKLRDKFRRKLFIILSHADGTQPSGRVAKEIRYDAFIKIWVEGYQAFPVSRYGGGKTFIIWQEGIDKLGY